MISRRGLLYVLMAVYYIHLILMQSAVVLVISISHDHNML